MPTDLAQEFAAAMRALQAAAYSSDARMWTKVTSEIRELQSRCAIVLEISQDEAAADAASIDSAARLKKARA